MADLLREKQRAHGLHRLRLGSKSQSSSDTLTEQVDRRISGRDGAQVSGDQNTVNVTTTDYGAVTSGFEAARRALDSSDTNARLLAGTTLGLFASVADMNERTLTLANGTYEGALSNTKATFGTAVDAIGKAFETAKAGDQRVVSIVGIAVVGLAAAALLFGKAR